ncbi:MAG: hypothetical protein F4174_06080 [Acidobacteria bacterium]|nr:hypothetical protein [Acidobacteriota bacterium]
MPPRSISDQLAAALQAERAALGKRLASLQERATELAKEQDLVKVRLGHIDALLHAEDIDRLHAAPSADASADHSIADDVVGLLREHGKALHYREIARKLQERGVTLPKGKDPAANLLAHFFNDPRVYRPQRGTYALRNGRDVQSVGTRRTPSKKGKRS